MPRVGFQPVFPVFERAKIFHALDCVATVISPNFSEIGKSLFGLQVK
jgi:hypothetical protein